MIKESYNFWALIFIVVISGLALQQTDTITGQVYRPGLSGLHPQLQENIRVCQGECDNKKNSYETCMRSPQDHGLSPNYCRETFLDKIEPCKKYCERFQRASWRKYHEPWKRYKPMRSGERTKTPSIVKS